MVVCDPQKLYLKRNQKDINQWNFAFACKASFLLNHILPAYLKCLIYDELLKTDLMVMCLYRIRESLLHMLTSQCPVICNLWSNHAHVSHTPDQHILKQSWRERNLFFSIFLFFKIYIFFFNLIFSFFQNWFFFTCFFDLLNE